jgi:hypothetical protein
LIGPNAQIGAAAHLTGVVGLLACIGRPFSLALTSKVRFKTHSWWSLAGAAIVGVSTVLLTSIYWVLMPTEN